MSAPQLKLPRDPDPEELAFAQQWLQVQIASAAKKIVTRVDEEFTPAMAHACLALNKVNRPLTTGRVQHLINEIMGGNWLRTHQGVGFSTEGLLIDGQHRCHAIIRTQKTVPLTMTFGLDPACFRVIDTGKQRSAGDVLHVHGHHDTVRLAAAARVLLAIKAGMRSARGIAGNKFSNADVDQYVDDHPDLPSHLNTSRRVQREIVRDAGGAGLAAGLFLIGERAAQYGDFVLRLRTGTGSRSENDPVMRLRARIGRQELDGVEYAACTIKAYNFFIERKLVTYIGWRGDELFPSVAKVKP